MNTLNDEETIKIIKNYVNDNNDSLALLINGKWGSGKTYFVKKIAIQKLLEINKKSIYISLYGVENKEEINQKIYSALLKDKSKKITQKIENKIQGKKQLYKIYRWLNRKDSAIKQTVKSGYDILRSVKKDLPNIPTEEISLALNSFEEIKNYVIFFDDLERSNISANKILGFINNYTENKGVKCIIIANEEEINKISIQQNIEQKYMVALSNNFLSYKENKSLEKIMLGTQKNNNEDAKISKEEIENRVEELFNENILYTQIKEKVIGATIFYQADIEEVYDNLTKNKICSKILTDNKNDILSYMKYNSHYNIRTLNLIIEYAELLIKEFNESDYKANKYFNDIIKFSIIYMAQSLTDLKIGKERKKWKSNELYTIDNYGKLSEIRVIDNYLESMYINKEELNNFLEKYIKEKTEIDKLNNLEILELQYYWEKEDSEIIDLINEIKIKLNSNLISISLYPKLLLLSIRLNNIGIIDNSKYDEIEKLMIENTKKENKKIDFSDYGLTFENDDEGKKYNETIKIIKNINLTNNTNKIKDAFNNIFENNSNWGSEFFKFAETQSNYFINQKRFMGFVDIAKLMCCIKLSNNNNYSNFRRTIGSKYNFQNIKELYPNDDKALKLLKDNLEEYIKSNQEQSKGKIYNINGTIDQINEFLKRYIDK